MACLAPNFVLLLTLVMYLSLSDGTTFSHFKTIPNFLGIVLKETQTVEVVGCIVECSYQLGSCWGIRFNVVSKQCQHLGYAMNQMNETFLSSGDWRIFRKVLWNIFTIYFDFENYILKYLSLRMMQLSKTHFYWHKHDPRCLYLMLLMFN